jgi:predicted amidohydrolase YtcJ
VSGVDLVLRGGTVRTGDAVGTRARALAVHDGRIVALDEDALALADEAQHVVDLDGGALLPGFGDGHVHPLWGGVELAGPPVRDATTVGEVVDVVRRWAAEHADLPWVVGGPYDPSLAPHGLFDAEWLDAAVVDRPVALQATDHHCAWVNTAALRLAGIDEHTPDPAAATIARRPDGTPMGTLVEWTAMDLVLRHAPATTFQAKVDGLAASTGLLAAAGVTWAQEAALHPDDVAAYLATEEAGRLSVRVDVALRAEPGEWLEQRAAFGAARDAAAASTSAGAVSVRTVKFFADGVVEAGTAAMLAPYTDRPHSCGLPVWDPAELAAAAAAFDADGFRLHIHAIGDAAVRNALDAVEHVARVNGPSARRPVIAHVQLVDPADLPRFAALGVVANVESLWAQLDPLQRDLTMPRLGEQRSALQYPFASLVANGGVLSMGSDWPVSSHRPLDGLAVAVTRQTSGGFPAAGWLPHERLAPETALSAYTAGSAYQSFEEAARGTLRVGTRADLVWLDRDPFGTPAAAWPQLAVRGTWLGGRRTAGIAGESVRTA